MSNPPDMKEKTVRENASMRLARMCAFDAPFCSAHAAVAAMDEVGRGPLAGPVVVACLLLSPDSKVLGVNDSKKVAEKKRESLCTALLEEALAVSYGVVPAEDIDRINILQATYLAASRAIEGMNGLADFLLCDELRGFSLPLSGHMMVDGDARSYRIAAASIVAKVYRDALLIEAHESYPHYGFAQHKGYGTAEHIAAIRKHGPCPLHRRSFLRRILP